MGKKAFVRDEKKARSEKSCPIRKIGEESEEDLVIVISDDEENPAATPVLNMNDVDTLTGAEWLNDAVINYFGKAAVEGSTIVFVESQLHQALDSRATEDKVSRHEATRRFLKVAERGDGMYVTPARVAGCH